MTLALGRSITGVLHFLVPISAGGQLQDVTWIQQETEAIRAGPALPLTHHGRKVYIQDHFSELCDEALVALKVTGNPGDGFPFALRCGAPGCHQLLLPANRVEWPNVCNTHEFWYQQSIEDVEDATRCHFWYIFCCVGKAACKEATAAILKQRKTELLLRCPDMFIERSCRVCGRKDTIEEPFKRCSRCQLAIYCGPACQALDWPTHRLGCVTKN